MRYLLDTCIMLYMLNRTGEKSNAITEHLPLISSDGKFDFYCYIETVKRLGHEVKDFLVRAWREAIHGNNDLEPLLQPAIAAR